jgi:hypothetical protein
MNVFRSLARKVGLRMHIEHSLTRCRQPHGQAHGPIRQGTHTVFADIAEMKNGANLEPASACAGVEGNCELEGDPTLPSIMSAIEYDFQSGNSCCI